MFNSIEVGKMIKKERKELGDSLESFADKIHITRQTLSRWEKGEGAGPSVEDFDHICQTIGCDIGYLFGEYSCKKRVASDVQEETGLSELAITNLLIAASGPDSGLLDPALSSNPRDYLRNLEIGRLAKIRFIQNLLEQDSLLEKLAVCAYDYRRYTQQSEMDSTHDIGGYPPSLFANVAKENAKEVLSELFKQLDWNVFSNEWED